MIETVDNRAQLAELDEIYKYKDLIVIADKDTIRKIIFKGDKKSNQLYNEFMKLVADEIDHLLNKNEFSEMKNQLMSKMKAYLERI